MRGISRTAVAIFGLVALQFGLPLSSRVAAQTRSVRPLQNNEMIRGVLHSVDLQKMTFTVKPTEGPIQVFLYTAQTTVTGAQSGTAGLATATGRQAVVRFRTLGARLVADGIDIVWPDARVPPPEPPRNVRILSGV